MPNEKNLRPVQSEKEAREKGRKGGIASGAARRRKRDMRQAAKLLLDADVSPSQKSMRMLMKSLGIDEQDMTYSMAILSAVLLQAGNGNVKAAAFLRDTAGYNPTQQLQEKQFAYQKKRDRERVDDDSGESGDGGDVVIYVPDNGRGEGEQICRS